MARKTSGTKGYAGYHGRRRGRGVLAVLLVFALVNSPAVVGVSATQRSLPVYSVERDDKKIALTIDAAWEDDKTDFILETLKSYNVKATFFLCGFWVEKYPEKVKAIYDAGHELGNHTATHPHMNKLSAAQMQKEIEDFEAMMVKITGEKTKVFRAPYGEYNDSVITTVRSLGYEVLQWDLDTVDMKWMPAHLPASNCR